MENQNKQQVFKPTEEVKMKVDFVWGGTLNFLEKSVIPLNENEMDKMKFEFAKIMKKYKLVNINFSLQRKW